MRRFIPAISALATGIVLFAAFAMRPASEERTPEPPNVPRATATNQPGGTGGQSPVDRYIVVLKSSVDNSGSVADQHKGRFGARVSRVYRHALKGYAARIPDHKVDDVRSDSRVAYVEPDRVARAYTTQTNATWGLDRVDQRALPLNRAYNYTSTGAGVDAYIIDTGIQLDHPEFGGRAVSGIDTIDGGSAEDCDGHGTHVAGTTGGSKYGVAKGARLVAVRVLDCSGSGLYSQVIGGVDWVAGNHQSGAPAVANMSLGGPASDTLDTAVRDSINDGVGFSIAAGNSNANACGGSPGRVAGAMTVSATNDRDKKPSWANYGSCVDWFSPGNNITSSYIGSRAATLSGTSMAAPHTAGAVALYLQTNPAASPEAARNAVYNAATKGRVSTSFSTNNHLLFKSGW